MNEKIEDIGWNKFLKTGSAIDYLKYKRTESMQNLASASRNDMEIGKVKGAKDIENIQGEGDSN